ncbi:serine/arginine repetitive matrix protein 1-like [Pimephales promelas]|uniref:serine/arginine repetitive matrix protein 1-like n=1 Tax=Pimephales promelas TaxID=90988 RepID=UPI001955A9E2|nr:serine/arginine repetitive matrix protein 1-like [Pimephales promelas]
MPIQSVQKAPVASSKVLTSSSHGAPMQEKMEARPKLKIPEPLRQELLQKKPYTLLSLQKAPVASSKVLTHSSHGAPMQEKMGARPKLKIPEPLRQELLQKKPYTLLSLQRAPAASSKVLTSSSHGAPMQEKMGARPKLKIPEPLRQELLQQKPYTFLHGPSTPDTSTKRQNQKIPEPEIAPVCCTQGVLVVDKISEMKDPKNPELLRKDSQNESPAKVRIPRKQREKLRDWWGHRQKYMQKGVSGRKEDPRRTTPERTLSPPCSPQQPQKSPEGSSMSRWRKSASLWSTEASDAGLCQAPPQKRCVEPRPYNCPAPQDSAGVDRSATQEKQQMAIQVSNQQSEPGSFDQMDYLSHIFAHFCIISNV